MKKKALKGDALMVAVLNQIIEHPETWDQKQWHCGTSHCFFGHAQIMGGRKQDVGNTFNDGKELLGLGHADANWLSSERRTLPEIYQFVKTWIDRDADGYDRAGHDRNGYDRDGYDRTGYDRNGYDRDGYDRTGHDRNGYDRDGYDRTGHDRNGYDRDGYDRDGYDRAGEPMKIVPLSL